MIQNPLKLNAKHNLEKTDLIPKNEAHQVLIFLLYLPDSGLFLLAF